MKRLSFTSTNRVQPQSVFYLYQQLPPGSRQLSILNSSILVYQSPTFPSINSITAITEQAAIASASQRSAGEKMSSP